MSSINDFDFLLGRWTIHNRRRTNAFSRKGDGIWEEFAATHLGTKYLDEKVNIEHFEGTFPSGEVRKGLTIRTYDPQSLQWAIRWLDNSNPHDFSPLIGAFHDGVGLFYEDTTDPDGYPVRVRFTWDNISEHTARWQQAFSFDGGNVWDTNWVMDFTR